MVSIIEWSFYLRVMLQLYDTGDRSLYDLRHVSAIPGWFINSLQSLPESTHIKAIYLNLLNICRVLS